MQVKRNVSSSSSRISELKSRTKIIYALLFFFLGQATPNFPRRHPFSCWLSSMLMCFSGSILTNFLLGESPIKDFLQHQHLLLATICWYLVFYSPIDFVASALRFLPIRILIVVAKEIHRTKRIFDGVHSTLVLYPEGYIIVVLIGAMKGQLN